MNIKYDANKNKLFQNPFLWLPEPSPEEAAKMLGGEIITIHPSTDSINIIELMQNLNNKSKENEL